MGSVGNVGILETFLEEFSWDFSDLPTLPIFPKLISLFPNEGGVLISKAIPRTSRMQEHLPTIGQMKQSSLSIVVDIPS